ncbi:MAG: aminotransferase class III-fold pyridoxal phosphate-dependent enzyme [Ilumatobacteraceae bacterium]
MDETRTDPLTDAVARYRDEYADRRPTSRSWNEHAAVVQPGANTRSVLHFDPFPFRVAHAEGRTLTDVDGHRYIDLLGNYTAGLLGHSPEPIRAAAHAAIDRGWALGSVHPDEVRLAEALTNRFASIDQIRFTNSGTEANLMALAVAVHHTGRSKVLVFRGGYHGGVLTFAHGPSPVNVPHDWSMCDYNDIDSVERAVDSANGDIAAVLVEPMQGSGGCIPGTPEFLTALREQCDAHGSVLIFDEVMTSRFSVGGAQQLLGITPDMTTLGKYLAGGFTFGAFGGSRDLMRHFDPQLGGELGHAGTFNNNVTSMAAGVAAVGMLTGDVMRATHRRGERLRAALDDIFAARSLGMCVTGMGSLMNVHGTPGPVSSAADLVGTDDRLLELFFFHCLERGWYLARRGFIALSIEITDADVDAFIDVAAEFDPLHP